MTTVAGGLAQHAPCEVAFSATVTSAPHFFYGTNTHAMHEEFSIRSDDGQALDVVDNVKIAPRVPVAVGDRIRLQGELVPDARPEPIVHWTHHDPRGLHPAGYIELNGMRYA